MGMVGGRVRLVGHRICSWTIDVLILSGDEL
jgi:hypothetical protein